MGKLDLRMDEMAVLAALYDGGYARIYDGPQPVDADGPLIGNNLLAEARFDSPAFQRSLDGMSTGDLATTFIRSGKATFVRFFQADGATVIGDLSARLIGMEKASLADVYWVERARAVLPPLHLT